MKHAENPVTAVQIIEEFKRTNDLKWLEQRMAKLSESYVRLSVANEILRNHLTNENESSDTQERRPELFEELLIAGEEQLRAANAFQTHSASKFLMEHQVEYLRAYEKSRKATEDVVRRIQGYVELLNQ